MSANSDDLPLAVALRERTSEVHKSAETSSFIGDLLEGRACPSAWGVLAVLPATAAYAAKLRESHTAEMMVAHHYVRYLGDLSGGQIIAVMLKRHYQVPKDALHFYRFDGIPKPKPYKDAYRAALNTLPATAEQCEQILDHAVSAFHLIEAVFSDIGAARSSMHSSVGVNL